MKLKVDKVADRTLRILEVDGWTVRKLAAATAEDLTGYEGIGNVLAWRIIVAARRANKAVRAKKPIAVDTGWLTPPPGAPGLSLDPPHPLTLVELPMPALEAKFRALAPDEEIPTMSVRVKRNWLVRRLVELGACV